MHTSDYGQHTAPGTVIASGARAGALWLLRLEHENMGVEVTVPGAEKIDWSECPLVEVKPEVQSGAPVLRGTRMPVSAIVDNFDLT